MAIYAYTAQNTDELSLAPGVVVTVLRSPDGGWWEGRADDKVRKGLAMGGSHAYKVLSSTRVFTVYKYVCMDG